MIPANGRFICRDWGDVNLSVFRKGRQSSIPALPWWDLGVFPLKKLSSLTKPGEERDGHPELNGDSMHQDMTDTSGVAGAGRQTLMKRFSGRTGAVKLVLTMSRIRCNPHAGFGLRGQSPGTESEE